MYLHRRLIRGTTRTGVEKITRRQIRAISDCCDSTGDIQVSSAMVLVDGDSDEVGRQPRPILGPIAGYLYSGNVDFLP